MTPMAGIGANTALRDAAALTRELTAAAAPAAHPGTTATRIGTTAGRTVTTAAATGDGTALLAAIHRYETEMLDYGFKAVRRSMRNARQSATSSTLGRAFFRTALRTTAAIPPLRRAMARTLGQ